MEMQSFSNAKHWVRVSPRARSAVLLLVIAMLPFVGHYAWFFGEYLANNTMSVLITGERLPLLIPAPDYWLLQAASLVLVGFAGLSWPLGEFLNYVQRAAESEMGE